MTKRWFSIGFLATAFLVLVAVVSGLYFKQDWKTLALVLNTLPFVVGVVTVTYNYPPLGLSSTVPPTALQMTKLSMVTATLNWGDTDVTATITHNMALTAAELTSLFPVPVVYAIALNGSPSAPPPFVSALGANSITVTKSSVTSSGGTFGVVIFRPETSIR
jgi:hypothetical protein